MRLLKGNTKKQPLSLQLNKSTPSTEGWQSMLQMPSTSQDQLQDQYNDMIQFHDGKWWTGSRCVSRVSDAYSNTAHVGIRSIRTTKTRCRPNASKKKSELLFRWKGKTRFTMRWSLATADKTPSTQNNVWLILSFDICFALSSSILLVQTDQTQHTWLWEDESIAWTYSDFSIVSMKETKAKK